jgi:hypothetical protein
MNKVGASAPTLFASFGFAKTSLLPDKVINCVFSNVCFASQNNQLKAPP